MFQKLVGFALTIVSGVILIAIKMLELPGIATFVHVLGTVALCMVGIVVLFAEEQLPFLRFRARKPVKYATVSRAAVSHANLDSIRPR